MKKYFVGLLMSVVCVSGMAESPIPSTTQSLPLENHAFQEADEHGHPAGWGVSHPVHLERNDSKVEIVREENFSYMRMVKTGPAENVDFGGQEVEIPDGAIALRVTVRMRGFRVAQGPGNWHFPGIGVTYHIGTDEARPGRMDTWIRLPEGDSAWRVYETDVPVRDNAGRASIGIVSQGWTGAADLADIQVQAVMPGH